jgi:hypothetical protein
VAALYVLDLWKVVLERKQLCYPNCIGKGHREGAHGDKEGEYLKEGENLEPGTITFHTPIFVRLHEREGELQASYEAASDAGKLFERLY